MSTASAYPSNTYGKSSETSDTGGKKSWWDILKQAFGEYSEDKVPRLSAALAFYTMLSLAPLLLIAIKIVGVIFKDTAQEKTLGYLKNVVGPDSAAQINQMVVNAGNQESQGTIAAIIGGIILLFSATGVFGELQDSMNTIFDVKPKPDRGFMGMIKDRFFSMTLVLGVAFLLLVSLIATTVINSLQENLLPGANWLWKVVGYVVAFSIITVLFAAMLKYLPDVKIKWRNVWVGALLTAALFVIGKFGLGWYLGRKSATSVYGTAGALVAVLIWVYYSSQIFFFGAEFTQVYARSKGDALEPTQDALAIDDPVFKQKSGSAAVRGGAMTPPKDPNAPEPWYPAVPVRKELAVVSTPGSVSSGSAGGGKLMPLLVGLAVGKFLLSGKKKQPKRGPVIKRQLAPARLVEPGWTTRKRLEEQEEYVLRVRPPEAVKKLTKKVRRGYETAKHRVAEYLRD